MALGAGTAVAIAAIPSSSDGVIHGCYVISTGTGQTTGQLRVIDPDTTPNCAGNEATLTWNQQGPIGPQGDPGPPGDSGSGSGTDTSGGGGFGSGGASPFDTSQTGGPSADIFLALDGIPGDSADAAHKNEISIESFAFLAKRPTTTPGATKLSSLRLDKVYDVSSPKLFAAATSGRHIKSAILTFSTSSDPSGTDVLTYKLSDVTVTSYEQGGANPDTKPLGSLEEEIGLRAARVSVSEKRLGASGQPAAPVTATWQVPRASSKR
ncbi:MAG: Hcp family type VI secretion system effector [Solirubrobacteraceae bacterium]